METFIHPTAVVDAGAVLGAGSAVWHFCHVSGGAILGERCKLGQNVFVADGVRLGNNVKVQNNVSLYSGVVCGDHVFIGPSVVFTNVRNPRSQVDRSSAYEQTQVGAGATLGANATIVCGRTIGHYAFIGAGSVVTKDVAPFALVVGNPAAQIGWMSAVGERLQFDELGRATCSATGATYQLHGTQVTQLDA